MVLPITVRSEAIFLIVIGVSWHLVVCSNMFNMLARRSLVSTARRAGRRRSAVTHGGQLAGAAVVDLEEGKCGGERQWLDAG